MPSHRHRCRASGAWAGRIGRPDGEWKWLAGSADPTLVTLDSFPGRWSPMRALPAELECLPLAVGAALAQCGAWQPGSGTPCAGGVVVGTDSAFVPPSVRFAHQIALGYSAEVSPADFIHSLPSTATSLLSKLYGFAEYQTTVVHGALSGPLALQHALELLEAGRVSRVLVAALSVGKERALDEGEEVHVAAALYLERESSSTGTPLEISVQRNEGSAPSRSHRGRLARLKTFGTLTAVPIAELADRLSASRGWEGSPFDAGITAHSGSSCTVRARKAV